MEGNFLDHRGNGSAIWERVKRCVKNYKEERWWRTLREGYTVPHLPSDYLGEGKWSINREGNFLALRIQPGAQDIV